MEVPRPVPAELLLSRPVSKSFTQLFHDISPCFTISHNIFFSTFPFFAPWNLLTIVLLHQTKKTNKIGSNTGIPILTRLEPFHATETVEYPLHSIYPILYPILECLLHFVHIFIFLLYDFLYVSSPCPTGYDTKRSLYTPMCLILMRIYHLCLVMACSLHRNPTSHSFEPI